MASLLDEDEHVVPRVGEPRGAHSRDIGDALDEELHALRLQRRAARGDVVAQQSDMRESEPGHVGPRGFAGRDRRVLDHLDDAVATVVDAHDRSLHHDRRGEELAHVAGDRVAVHAVRRRQDDEAQDVAVPGNGGIDVGNVQRGVRQTADHENERSIPRTHCALSVLFQPASMPSLRSSHP